MTETRSKKVTVADIAREANVSPATVSRVINQRFNLVTEDTVRLVQETMDRLGYALPEEKRYVSPGKSVLIFNIPNGNLYYNKVIQGAIASANAHGCHLLINECVLDSDTIGEFLKLLKSVGAAGVIVVNQVETEILHQIRELVPVIQCSEFNLEAGLPYVSIDDVKAARTATQYLIGCGRKKIALLNGPTNYKYSRERRKGFLAALDLAGLTPNTPWLIDLPDINYDMAYSAVCQMLNAEPIPDAFFAVSDILATAVIKAASQFGFRVPDDIMVIGFDNISVSKMCTPSITTVNQPAFQQGFTSCELLIKLVNNPRAEINSILLETELIIRETT